MSNESSRGVYQKIFPYHSIRGFTLIELLISIALVSILLIIIVPSFSVLINSNKLTSTRDLLINSLSTAQQKALSKSISTYICPTKNGTSCMTTWTDSTGWLIYEDLDRNSSLSAGEIIISQAKINIKSIANSTAQIQFRSTGHVIGTTSFTLCNSTNVNGAQINISSLGNISYQKVGGC